MKNIRSKIEVKLKKNLESALIQNPGVYRDICGSVQTIIWTRVHSPVYLKCFSKVITNEIKY